jgi:hypothetical protein
MDEESTERTEPDVREMRDGSRLVLEADGTGGYVAPAGFVDVHGACEMLGVGRSKLTKLQKQGRIPGVRWARYPEADKPGARRIWTRCGRPRPSRRRDG